VHASSKPWVKTPSEQKKYTFIKVIFLRKNVKYKIKDTIKPITGTKNSECVKCLWYSKKRRGSLSDLIKISKSEESPPINPQIEALLKSFLLENEQDKFAPIRAWEHGSI